jgi:hypothetical protein
MLAARSNPSRLTGEYIAHERSTSANQHRRSEAVHRHDLGVRSSTALDSNPTSSCTPTDLLIAPYLPHGSDLPTRAANQLPEVGPDQPNRLGLPHGNRYRNQAGDY